MPDVNPQTPTFLSGHCLCGQCGVDLLGDPVWVGHCHCPSCRRATSAAFATYLAFDRGRVRFLGENRQVFKSSASVSRHFCRVCGSAIALEGEAWPGEIHIHVGLFDNLDHVTPQHHLFADKRAVWAEIDDGLPRFSGFRVDRD